MSAHPLILYTYLITRQYISEDEESRNNDDEDEDMEGSQKQRVEVSLEMPQLPLPYSDTQKVTIKYNEWLHFTKYVHSII